MFGKAPILAWILTVLTCVLVGLTALELRSHTAVPLVPLRAVEVVTVEVLISPKPGPTSEPPPTPTPGPCDPSNEGASPFCTGNAR